MAGLTYEARYRMSLGASEQIAQALRGEEPGSEPAEKACNFVLKR